MYKRQVQGGVGLGPDAGQTLVRLCTLQSGQAGVQRGQCTAVLGGEPGAEAVGADESLRADAVVCAMGGSAGPQFGTRCV